MEGFFVGRVVKVEEGLLTVEKGVETLKVYVKPPQIVGKLRELIRNGNEALVKVLIEGFVGRDCVKGSVELVNVGVNSLGVDALDPSNPERFSKMSYLTIKLPKYRKVLKVQHELIKSFRNVLDSEGFIELLPPVISPVSDPGLRGARKLTTELYGFKYELTSSTIMFKQVAATALGKIYFMARNVREEPPHNLSTGRHLVEFTQLDLEWSGATVDDVIKLGEKLVYESCLDVKERLNHIVSEFNPDLKCFKPPYRRLSFKEVLEVVRGLGYEVSAGGELPQEAEEGLSKAFKEPFWIVGFPSSSRGFYYLKDERDPTVNRDFNLILPEGYGEVIDGGEREYRYEYVVNRLRELNEDLERYSWFLNALKAGIAPTAGFGLGVERYTRYLLKLRYVWEAVPFPKPPGVVGCP
ncbi:MAG: hypothetical protein B7O98_02150 [Zestosphaera tikiterensis]|uniref:Aminoacyl-transfer RNA synthetases class-II family profile domain-containing protein n=1 Tax=Zestosphaera tikiterensis TaxID=1973259 RepID=A0A2R7Y7G3_9CREN|nr:MAG: hypothetical protein B7O98_02150 [Zestosphaera tikiterensis]